ncbi:RAD protein [Plasmodium ovale wallikeri]|uniref:RAD protein n=2 Tax=Plasmodium ovale TaxID=36330 RepID=A0A1A9ALQ5_PLAOA|nr:RAD protein [Plasmodium ovale wallikeri]SBT58985.1 RAD protein [Plasmodium ovale wallikeri]SBT72669.1 RAD protein [Plasmodium ovale]
MGKKFNLKNISLFSLAMLLFVLISIILIGSALLPNESTLSELHLNKSSRNLSESSSYLNDSVTRKTFSKNDNFNHYNLGNSRLSHDFKRYSKKLDNFDIYEELDKCGRIVLNKREAHKVLNNFMKYIKGKYSEMMNRLSYNFHSYASKKGIPKLVQVTYWRECEEVLSENLRMLQKEVNDYIYNFMKAKVVFTPNFKVYSKTTQINFIQYIENIEREWTIYLNNKMQNYVYENVIQRN